MTKILRCPKCGFTRTKYAWDDMTSTNGAPNIHELGFEREMRLDRKHMEQCDSLYTSYEVLQPFPEVRCDVYRPDVQTRYSKARGARVGGAEMPTRIAEFNQYLNESEK